MIYVLVLLLILVERHFRWKARPWPARGVRPPQFQAHRGYWMGGAQENTLEAFRAAAARGLKMIELDVRLAKDVVPIVFHDVNLKRMVQRETLVSDCLSEELHHLVNAPTLAQVLTSADVPQLLNIELKTTKIFSGSLERTVASVIKKYGAEERVLISSFNPLALWRISFLLPEVPRALLATLARAPENKFYLRYLWLAPYIRVNALHLDGRFTDIQSLKRWIRRGVPVVLWTVNDPQKAEEYLGAGALSVITDTLA